VVQESEDMRSNRQLYWWAGIASVLPRTSAIPATGKRWVDRWNELRWALARPPVFPWPDVSKVEARALAKPTCSGFGDLICAWMMPMTVTDIMGWQLRIPVPQVAGGIHHEPHRPLLTAEWFRTKIDLPPHVELVPGEGAPDDCEGFCTVEPQWYLTS